MRNPFAAFELRETIDIDRPASVVCPYLLAFEQVPKWEGGVVWVRQITPERRSCRSHAPPAAGPCRHPAKIR
jgi:hypothetical protein